MMVIMTPSNQQILAMDLIGEDAVHHEERVGEVYDILLDKDGQVAGIVLAVGDLLGAGKLVALPWDSVKVSRKSQRSAVGVAMTREELESAPYFELMKHHWADAV